MKSFKYPALIIIIMPLVLILYGTVQPDRFSKQPSIKHITVLKRQPKISAARGKKIAQKNDCFSCHSTDGTQKSGPTWKNLYGHKVSIEGDSTITADSAYIATSITNPNSEIVKGYTAVMPNFGYLEKSKVESLVAYIKSLSNVNSRDNH
jgi:cytochrome c oxidase subunit 2